MKTSVLILTISLFIVIVLVFKDSLILSANEEKGLVELHYVDNISSAHEKIIEAFNEEYQGKIKVIPVNLPFTKFSTNERKEILARSLRSKSERIDIFAVDLIWAPRFAKWSVPLDTYFDADYTSRFWKHTIESCSFQGSLVALPLYTDVGLMFYRIDLIDKIGIDSSLLKSITWQDFIKLGERFKNKSNPFFLFAGDSFEGMICSFHESLPMGDSREIFGNEKIDLNNDGARKSLQLMVDLIHKYKYAPKEVLGFDENKSRLYALEHDAVFIRGWPGFFKDEPGTMQYREKSKNYRVMGLPHWKGEQKNAVYGGWNLMISKYSKNKREALQFLEYMVSEESQHTLYSESGYFPALKSIYNNSEFSKDKTLKLYFDLLKNGKHRPFRENYTQVSDIMAHYLHKALQKEISVDQALNLATEKINSRQVFIK